MGDCWENEELNSEFLSKIKARSDRFNRIMIEVCSLSIKDERGIFTYSIRFRMNEIFKSKVFLIQKLKGNKGS